MSDRRVELLEHVTIDLCLSTHDLDLNLFGQRAAEVAHHAWKSMDAVRKWPHAAGHRAVIQAARQTGYPAIERIQFRQALVQIAACSLRTGFKGRERGLRT